MSFDYSYVLPATGQAENAPVREMFDDIKTYVNTIVPSAGAAPVNAQYLTLAVDATLTVERVLTAGAGIGFTDNGAGSTLVVANTGVRSIATSNINSSFNSPTGAVTFSFSSTPTFSSIILQSASGAVGITPSASVFTSYNLTLPLDTGTNGYVLSTNGATPTATLSWVAQSSGATVALDNLASVAINTSLLPGTTNAIDLGSASKEWRDIHISRDVVLYETSTSNNIIIKSPSSLASYTLTLPDSAGTNTYLLSTNGSGTTSWVAPVSTSNFATKALDNLAAVAINTSLISDTNDTDDLGTISKAWKLGYFQSGIHFKEQDGGTDSILVKAPSSVATAYTFTLPPTGGTNNYLLKTNGSGTTDWVSAGTILSAATPQLDNLSSVAVNTSIISDTDNTDNLGSGAIEWANIYTRILYAGYDGKQGSIALYPATASNGFWDIHATNNGGARNLTLTNDALAGSRAYNIPDAGADAKFVMSEGAMTINGAKTFGSVILHASGSVSAPNGFSTDTNNGFYYIGTDNWGLSANSTKCVDIKASGVAILGSNTNDSAAAGFYGEIVTASASSSFVNYPTSAQFGDLTSISLTAGDWLVSCYIEQVANGAVVTSTNFGISTTSGNSGTGLTDGVNYSAHVPSNAASGGANGSIPFYHVQLTTTTIHYLKYISSYTGGPPQATGRITAIRIR